MEDGTQGTEIEQTESLEPGVLLAMADLFRDHTGYHPDELFGTRLLGATEDTIAGRVADETGQEVARLKALIDRQAEIHQAALAEVDRLEWENQRLGDKLEELVRKEKAA